MDLAVAAVAAFGTQVAKGVTGFGGTLMLVPVLALLWGPREAVFVSACSSLVGGVVMVPEVRRDLRPVLVAAVVLPMLGTTWIGTRLLAVLPERTVALVMAVLVAWFALELLWRPVRPGRGEALDLPSGKARARTLGLAGVAGAAGGLLGGLTGASGPPIVVFMRAVFADRFFRAQLVAIFLISDVWLITLLLAQGQAGRGALVRVGWLVVPLLIGNRVGVRLVGRMSKATFGRVVGGLLALAAAMLAYG